MKKLSEITGSINAEIYNLCGLRFDFADCMDEESKEKFSEVIDSLETAIDNLNEIREKLAWD